MGSIISHLDELLEEYGTWENYRKHIAEQERRRTEEIRSKIITDTTPAAREDIRHDKKREP